MPRSYRTETEINAISDATGNSYTRLSEARIDLHGQKGLSGSRGNNYDQIQFLRVALSALGAAPGTSNQKLSDGWLQLEWAIGGSSTPSKRWKEAKLHIDEGEQYESF